MNRSRRRTGAVLVLALAVVAGACSSDSSTTSTTNVSTTAPSTPPSTSASTPASSGSSTSTDGTPNGEAISAADCVANKAAGKVTYLSSFDFSASASIIDVVVAKAKGYFATMCLDVDLRSGISTDNYPLVAANQAQFSSAGNYTEILNFSKSGAKFTALVNYGKTPIEALVTKDPTVTDLSQLKGKTIGVKKDIPPSIVAMLAKAGLQRGKDYNEVLLDGFDPVAQLRQAIDALPVYKSNEPNRLDAEGVKYGLVDPAKVDVPGTFGLIYTSAAYAKDHPTVVAAFTRASLRGMEDAMADPAAAVTESLKLIDAAGNQAFLTQEGETFRWKTELGIVKAGTPAGEAIGAIDPALFAVEYQAYLAAGVWPNGAPTEYAAYDADLARSMYGSDGKVVWPAS